MHPSFKQHLERLEQIPHRLRPGALVKPRLGDPAFDGLLGKVIELQLDHTHAHVVLHTDACYTPEHLRYTVQWMNANGDHVFVDQHREADLGLWNAHWGKPLAELTEWQVAIALSWSAPGTARAELRAELLRRKGGAA